MSYLWKFQIERFFVLSQKSFKKCCLHENEAEYGKHKNKRTLTENESNISFDLLNQMTSNFQGFVFMLIETELWYQIIHKVSFADICLLSTFGESCIRWHKNYFEKNFNFHKIFQWTKIYPKKPRIWTAGFNFQATLHSKDKVISFLLLAVSRYTIWLLIYHETN